MIDNNLINLLATQLEAASASAGWGYLVVQKDQPSTEGIPTAPTIFFEKLFDKHYGSPSVASAYQPTQDNFSKTEIQVVETTFQISALVHQDPNNLNLPTASDVVNYLKQYLQSEGVMATLVANQAAMYRVSEIRNPFFMDDKEQYEANPSFDVVLVHNSQVTFTVGAASRVAPAPSPIPGDTTTGVFVVPDSPGQVVPG